MINGAKCKIISQSNQAVLDGNKVKHVNEFVYLESVVPNSSNNDVKRQISLASAAFDILKIPIWW